MGEAIRGEDGGCDSRFCPISPADGEGARGVDVVCIMPIMDATLWGGWGVPWGGGVGEAGFVMMVGFCLMKLMMGSVAGWPLLPCGVGGSCWGVRGLWCILFMV